MSRKKPKARKHSKRSISVRPIYRDKPDTEALAKALVHWALTHPDAGSHSDPETRRNAS